MATKSNSFDMLILRIGYTEFIMPREAALAFMNACAGADVYRHETRWVEQQNKSFIKLVDMDDTPTIKMIGPVQFHQGLENHRMEEEMKRAKSTV